MGKLVKRAELSLLGAIGIALFSSTHLPTFLSTLDNNLNTDQDSYTASAMTPYVDDTVSQPSPVTITTAPIVAVASSTLDSSSTPDTTTATSGTDSASGPVIDDSGDNASSTDAQ